MSLFFYSVQNLQTDLKCGIDASHISVIIFECTIICDFNRYSKDCSCWGRNYDCFVGFAPSLCKFYGNMHPYSRWKYQPKCAPTATWPRSMNNTNNSSKSSNRRTASGTRGAWSASQWPSCAAISRPWRTIARSSLDASNVFTERFSVRFFPQHGWTWLSNTLAVSFSLRRNSQRDFERSIFF